MAPRKIRQAAGSKNLALDFAPGIDRQVRIEFQIKDGFVHPRSAIANRSLRLRNSSGLRLWQNNTAA